MRATHQTMCAARLLYFYDCILMPPSSSERAASSCSPIGRHQNNIVVEVFLPWGRLNRLNDLRFTAAAC